MTAVPHAADDAGSRPLLQAQEGIWFAQRLDPENPIFNTSQIATLHGPLDRAAFANAVDRALREAPLLAARFIDGRDRPEQVIGRAPATLTVHDFGNEADPAAAARAHIDRDMARPRDPTCDPLVTEQLLILGPAHHVWYQNIHHLVIDGYGTALLNRRIAALYNEAATGIPAQDTELSLFYDFFVEDAVYVGSAREAADRAFWHELFNDRPQVAGMAQGEAATGRSFHRFMLALPDDAARAVTEAAAQAGVAWPDWLTALTGAFVARHAGSEEAIVGVPHMGRFGSAAARLPAMVMNVLPLRLRLDEDAPPGELAAAAARALTRARRHGRYRSEQLRRDLGLLGRERRLYGPLANILPFDAPLGLSGIAADIEVPCAGAVDDLTFTLRADPAGRHIRLELDANPALYTAERTRALALRFAAFVQAAARAGRLADVPTLSPDETGRWLAAQRASAHPVEDTTLAALLARAVRATPDTTALVDGDRRWTYAELERETVAVARRLRAAGARAGDVVAVALPRSHRLVLTLLACLRIGAAYLPLDADHPGERLARILQSAKPRVVVTLASLRDRLPADTPLLIIDHDATPDNGDDPFHDPAPPDAAYVIYTSGSTGMPKGVVVEHRAIVNRLLWMAAHYGIGPGDRILQKTPATFDVSVWEFFLPLIAGATLVVAPPDAHKDPAALAGLVRTHAITAMHFVPSMLALFLDEPTARGLAVRRVFVSGEELPSALRDRFHTVIAGELHNLYGPTEAAVDVSYWNAAKDDRSRPVPIGFPVWNTRLYVLDARLRPLPADSIGELYLAGRQLARGYLGQPELTRERFVADPFFPGERMYRTGDLALAREDGAIVFLGRTDHQVKLRGLRIELGEIETAALADGAVAQAVVDARGDGAGGKRLVAYVTAKPGRIIDAERLRAAIAARVPDYMVPAAFITLDRLPLSTNGKLDRKALPEPAFAPQAGRPPATATERQVATLFARCLGRDESTISADDDFFGLGGHSLLAAKLMQQVREAWAEGLGDNTLGLGVVFTDPTVARLAARIDAVCAPGRVFSATENEGLAPLIRLNDGRGAPLFCIHPAGGIAWCYAGLARALPDHAVYGLQARGLDGETPAPASIDALAADYIARIRAIVPEGPLHLAGWSVGGIIAHAMAVQLAEAGTPPGLLALLDAYPSDSWREQSDPSEDVSLKALVQIAGHDVSELGDAPLTRDRVVAYLRAIGNPLGLLSDRALSGVVQVVAANNRLVRDHWHRLYPGDILYFRAALDHAGTGLAPRLWAPYAGALDVREVPSLHAHLTGTKAIGHIAPAIAAQLHHFSAS
ncbi:MAG: amino acid adenylation domain-containing protein [Pseudochelatococcus sp.]|jgi:enterobactin synthetase component F|uniref:amino acid adenylation domain-containing protein n=1 Tax=Pseudochelatococcus sp. TaxID=2020869 RepID=UPI003D93962F